MEFKTYKVEIVLSTYDDQKRVKKALSDMIGTVHRLESISVKTQEKPEKPPKGQI